MFIWELARARAACRELRANGVPGKNSGVLDDYANMAEGLLTLYEVTGAPEWLSLARTLMDTALEFFDDGNGGFFDTARDSEKLIRRPRDFADNAEPSGWFSMANLLVRFSALAPSDFLQLRIRAEQALGVVPQFALEIPKGSGLGSRSHVVAGPGSLGGRGEWPRKRQVCSTGTALTLMPGNPLGAWRSEPRSSL